MSFAEEMTALEPTYEVISKVGESHHSGTIAPSGAAMCKPDIVLHNWTKNF